MIEQSSATGAANMIVCLNIIQSASRRRNYTLNAGDYVQPDHAFDQSIGLFRIRQIQAFGGSGRFDSKWPETSERISKYDSTAFTMSLAVRCGGPGPRRFSSAFPIRLSHKP